MNGKELIQNLNNYISRPGKYLDDILRDTDSLKDEFGEVEIVEEIGDTEGGGEKSVKVLHFKDHDVYVKFSGYYTSYDGTTWNDEFKQVYPRKVEVVQYFDTIE